MCFLVAKLGEIGSESHTLDVATAERSGT